MPACSLFACSLVAFGDILMDGSKDAAIAGAGWVSCKTDLRISSV